MMAAIEGRQLASRSVHAGLVILAGALIMSAAMGSRQTFGLFIGPFSFDRGMPVTLTAFAIALHNLVWGFTQPFAGAAADRWGSAPVVAFGAVAFAAGLVLTALASSGLMLVLGLGVLVGIGISCTTFGVVLTALGRAAPPEQAQHGDGPGQRRRIARPGAAGAAVAMGHRPLGHRGVAAGAGRLPAGGGAAQGLVLDRQSRSAPAQAEPAMPLRVAVAQALGHRGYRLLTLGFFTCGFQLAFIGDASAELPAAVPHAGRARRRRRWRWSGCSTWSAAGPAAGSAGGSASSRCWAGCT